MWQRPTLAIHQIIRSYRRIRRTIPRRIGRFIVHIRINVTIFIDVDVVQIEQCIVLCAIRCVFIYYAVVRNQIRRFEPSHRVHIPILLIGRAIGNTAVRYRICTCHGIQLEIILEEFFHRRIGGVIGQTCRCFINKGNCKKVVFICLFKDCRIANRLAIDNKQRFAFAIRSQRKTHNTVFYRNRLDCSQSRINRTIRRGKRFSVKGQICNLPCIAFKHRSLTTRSFTRLVGFRRHFVNISNVIFLLEIAVSVIGFTARIVYANVSSCRVISVIVGCTNGLNGCTHCHYAISKREALFLGCVEIHCRSAMIYFKSLTA